MVALAYLTGNAAFFQKQANGKLSAAATVLLLPYLVGVRLNMAYWLRGKAKTVQVRNDVLIGSVLGISNHLPAVLDVCAEHPCRSYQGAYRALPLLDMVTPSENDLVQTALILETLRQKTRQSAGMLRFGLWKKCRSGTDVAAGLWWLQRLDASEG